MMKKFLRDSIISSCLVIVFFIICISQLRADPPKNPFAIPFQPKEQLSQEDYITIQKQLREIDIDPLLKELYVGENLNLMIDFQNRCTKGIKQILIDPEKELLPITRLEKIGNGSDMCVVTCCPYNRNYSDMIKVIPEALKECGFNGHFYYRIGGYPNPTGKEIQYVGVPYAFKIFMMLEAQKQGFNKVLWIDSAILPLRDPTPLFNQLEETGCFLLDYEDPGYNAQCILPKTRQILKELTEVDVVDGKHISSQVFGLKMDTEKTKEFVKSYYKFAEMGTPFLSCFPEEFVFDAIFKQSKENWPSQYVWKIIRYPLNDESKSEIEKVKEDGFLFYLRQHPNTG